MQQVSSSQFAARKTKLTIQINSPSLQPPKAPRTPAFSRKGSHNRREKGMESLKSSESRSLDKSLKYTKILPREEKNNDSEIHSQVHIIRLLSGRIEDYQETVIHRGRSQSHKKDVFLHPKSTVQRPKSPGRKVLEDFSAANESFRKSRINHKSDEHYIYWKNKAYQYLESNIKLMEEVRKLTRQNNDLKTVIANLQQTLKAKDEKDESKIYTEKTLSKELRNISSIYINKIESMEKELKRKEIIIATYELKVNQLNTKLYGDNERIKLIAKLQEEIENLRAQYQENRLDHLKFESNFHVSTSILTSQTSNR